ncbi:ribonuclease H-like domain-containing protein [Tanacetum coccineum]|uniref:Ribonuclease H-like domain-containing protein n=1 Tax=Tanacetum coccineum TaxID=301880 RepID=A0ABQ5E107_9ASTR
MTSPIPSPTFSMPTPSPTFSFPSTSEPVFSVSTSEPAFESQNYTQNSQNSQNSQTSQNTQSQQQFQQYHTTTVSNNNAKFPYLKKDEYETWAMKMEYWIMNSDHNLWNIVLNGNSRKKTGRDPKGNIMILPPVSVEEHIAIMQGTSGWLSKPEGLHKGYDRFQKILSQLIQMQSKPDNEDCNMKFLRALPPSWVAQVMIQEELDLEELDIKWLMAMLSVRINRFEKKAGRKMKFNNKDAARFGKKKVKCYKCSELGHFARECTKKQLDSKARYSSFKLNELDKSEEPKALLSVDSMLNWSDHEGEDVENSAAHVYGMIAGTEDVAAGSATGDVAVNVSNDVFDAAAEFALMEVQYKDYYIQVQAYKSTLQTLEQQKGWYQSNQLALEERIKILTADLENTTNMLKYVEKLNDQTKLEKLNAQVKLEESEARFDKWKESSKNLVKLINSSMSSRSKFGLGYGETFGSDEVFDLSAPSIFDTTPEDVEGKPLYDRFVKLVGMHDVPPPIAGTFMPPSNKPDLDDTQVTYVTSPQTQRPLALHPVFQVSRIDLATVSVSADRHVPAGSINQTTQQFLQDCCITKLNMDEGRKGTAVKDPSVENPHKNKDLGIVDSGLFTEA